MRPLVRARLQRAILGGAAGAGLIGSVLFAVRWLRSRVSARSEGSGSRRLRVTLLVNTLDVGGSELQVVNLARRLDRTRFDTRIVVFGDGVLRAEVERLGAPLTVLNLPVPRLHNWRQPGTAWGLLRIIVALVRDFRAARPDIVDAFLLTSCLAGGIAVWLSGSGRLIANRRGLGELRTERRLSRLLESTVSVLAQQVTCNSRAVMQDILDHERVGSTKLSVRYNGIDTRPFRRDVDRAAKRRELSLPTSAPVIGCVANLSPIKGHLDLIRALAILLQDVPDACLALVGEDRGMQGQIEALADACNVRERVYFLGLRRDLPELLPVFDVQAQCSHSEAFSNAILEGGAAGVPLIVTGVGGNLEQVVHEETGLIVPPRCPEAIAEAMRRLLADRASAARLADGMRRRVEEQFSTETMVSVTEQLYARTGSSSRQRSTVPGGMKTGDSY